VIEGEVVARAAILAGETVAQKNIEAREGRLPERPDIALERDDARQLHLEARAMHRVIVERDDIHAIEKHRLDGVLPGPDREGVIAQRTKIRVEHQRRPGTGR
jgi:hypothetical protein